MTETPEGWATRLRENRAEKDRFFAEHRQSPIPPEERDDFDGLDYFEPNQAYRVEATVAVYDDPERVDVETSDGRRVPYDRAVALTFDIDGGTYELQGYRQPNDDSDTVFVPFRDKTTGQQTYENGRYIELEPERELREGEEVALDFNLAYSPFCAFSETFSCPLPPEENWLDTTIEAGEKTE